MFSTNKKNDSNKNYQLDGPANPALEDAQLTRRILDDEKAIAFDRPPSQNSGKFLNSPFTPDCRSPPRVNGSKSAQPPIVQSTPPIRSSLNPTAAAFVPGSTSHSTTLTSPTNSTVPTSNKRRQRRQRRPRRPRRVQNTQQHDVEDLTHLSNEQLLHHLYHTTDFFRDTIDEGLRYGYYDREIANAVHSPQNYHIPRVNIPTSSEFDLFNTDDDYEFSVSDETSVDEE